MRITSRRVAVWPDVHGGSPRSMPRSTLYRLVAVRCRRVRARACHILVSHIACVGMDRPAPSVVACCGLQACSASLECLNRSLQVPLFVPPDESHAPMPRLSGFCLHFFAYVRRFDSEGRTFIFLFSRARPRGAPSSRPRRHWGVCGVAPLYSPHYYKAGAIKTGENNSSFA